MRRRRRTGAGAGGSDRPGTKAGGDPDAWAAFAGAVGGTVVDEGRGAGDKVAFDHAGFRVWAGTQLVSTGNTVVTVTRVRSYYSGFRGFEVTVRPRNVLDALVAALGLARTLPLPPRLLERFVVKGDPSSRVPSLFTAGLTEVLLEAPGPRLSIGPPSRKERRRLGEGWGEVSCRVTGTVGEAGGVALLADVVGHALDALVRIGEARAPED